MTCSQCGAALRRDTLRDCMACDYCKSSWCPAADAEGVRVYEQAANMPCPACHALLYEASIEARPIHYCRTCRGILINVEEFLYVRAELRAKAGPPVDVPPSGNPDELEQKRRCPGCARLMDTFYYGGGGNVAIDNCPHCEWNWLDHGELQRITRAPDPKVIRDESIPNPALAFWC